MTSFEAGVAEGMSKHASAAAEAVKDAPGFLSRALWHLKEAPSRAGQGAGALGELVSSPVRSYEALSKSSDKAKKRFAINAAHTVGLGGLGATGVYALGKRSGRREQG